MSTLGLNMIVGPGEAGHLKRCLDSFKVGEYFDEIVIVNTSKDTAIDQVAKSFTDKVFFYPWETPEHPHGDFGGARDFARAKSTSDKIMWLDADDALMPQHIEGWERAVSLVKDPAYADVMMWSIPYSIIIDGSGDPMMWFKRERIFDRKQISWRRPVHELLFPEWDMVKNARINGNVYVTHLPSKPNYQSAVRNVAILEHEVASGNDDVQTRYFLGRDLMYTGQVDRGIGILDGIVSEMETSTEMMYAIAVEIVWYYAYNGNCPRPCLHEFNVKNLLQAESWCRLALSYTADYAEPYVLLGDIYYHKGDMEAAMRMYLAALKKRIGVGKFQTVPMYNEIPYSRLCYVFKAMGKHELALHWNKKSLEANRSDEYVICRHSLLKDINEEFNREFSKD